MSRNSFRSLLIAAVSVGAGLALASACTVEPDDTGNFGSGLPGADADDGGMDGSDGDAGDGDGDAGDGDGDGDGDGESGDGDGDGEPGDGDGDGEPSCGNGAVEVGEDCDGMQVLDNAYCTEECAWECDENYGDCNDNIGMDGCESWLMLADNCGGCGVVCGNGQSCVVGACEVTKTHGNDQEYDKGNIALAHNLLGNKISVPSASQLTHMSVYSKQAGPKGQFALYEDNGGEPGALVASTPEVDMVVGLMEIPIGDPVDLPAGDYWFLGVFNINASIGLDTSDGSAVVKYIPFTFGTQLPDPFPQANEYTGQLLNYFVTVL